MSAHRDRFVETLQRLAGANLTPEVAKALLYAFDEPPDAAVDPFSIRAKVHGDYVFQAEPFAALIDELHPLHQAQWEETEEHRHGLPFEPDYESGKRFEKAGSLIQFTIRLGSELVGHMRMYLLRSVHTSTFYATVDKPVSHEDTVYIKPEHRHGLLGLAFVRYVEEQIIGLGVREIRFDTKRVNNADAILRRLGYDPAATRWVKVLKE